MGLNRLRRSLETVQQNLEPRDPAPADTVRDAVPPGMIIAGAWAWRLLAIFGVAAVLIFLIIELKDIVVPLLVAVLVAALLVPFARWLQRHGWPKWLTVAVAEIGLLAIVTGLVWLVVSQIRGEYPALRQRTVQQYDMFRGLLEGAGITQADINMAIDSGTKALQNNSSALFSGALSVGSTGIHLITGLLLVLFSTLFILIDGRTIWNFVVRIFPKRSRRAVDGAGQAGWLTLATFVKVQIFVAAVDAVGIGLGAWILGLVSGPGFPLLIPIAVVVFLGSFVPVVGAIATGVLAVFVALVYLGPVQALIMLGIVLLVHQTEAHVLQPLVMGSAVKVHPLAVVLAVAAGGFIAGIPGTLFAVPLVAVVNKMIGYVASGKWKVDPSPDVHDVATPL